MLDNKQFGLMAEVYSYALAYTKEQLHHDREVFEDALRNYMECKKDNPPFVEIFADHMKWWRKQYHTDVQHYRDVEEFGNLIVDLRIS